MHPRFLPFVLGLLLLSPASVVRALQPLGAADVSRLRGVNYIPSYAASPYETWANYDPATVRRELGWAAGLGFNAVRVVLSCDAYRERPTAFLESFADFVVVARVQGLGVEPVLFDAWGVDPSFYLGEERESLARSFERMRANPAAYRADEAFFQTMRTTAVELLPDRLVPRSADPAVLLWGAWRPSPALDALSERDRSGHAAYVRQVVEPYATDAAILGWDVMNEPSAEGIFRRGGDRAELHRFVQFVVGEVRGAGASQAVTASFSGGYGATGVFLNELDWLSVLCLRDSAADLHRGLMEMEAIGKGRPVLIAQAGGVFLPRRAEEAGDEAQLAAVRRVLSVAESRGAGWFVWHLVEGEAMTPWAGLLRRDGTPKPAAEFIRRELRAGSGRATGAAPVAMSTPTDSDEWETAP